MWLRDSTNQVLPYLKLAKRDPQLARMLAGLVRRQTAQVTLDPYANAHTAQFYELSPNSGDSTSTPNFAGTRTSAMVPGVYERKYELDSLMAFLKLSRSYFAATSDPSPFEEGWLRAVRSVFRVLKQSQLSSHAASSLPSGFPYQFARTTSVPTDTLLFSTGPPVSAAILGPPMRVAILGPPVRVAILGPPPSALNSLPLQSWLCCSCH